MSKKILNNLLSGFIVLFLSVLIVGVVHADKKLFAQENKKALLIASATTAMITAETTTKAPKQSWLAYVASLVYSFFTYLLIATKNIIVEIFKQAIKFIHQTIVIALLFWFFGLIKAKWVELAPRLYESLDNYMDNTNIEKRSALKNYISVIVTGAIDAVEAAFVLKRAPHLSSAEKEDYHLKQQLSKDKAAAALSLIIKDLVAGKLDTIATKNQTVEEFVKGLLATIEQQLLEKKLRAENEEKEAFSTELYTTYAKMTVAETTGRSVRCTSTAMANIEHAQKSIPLQYTAAIHAVVDATFKQEEK